MGNLYWYRRGDGNEGNFKRRLIELGEDESPYDALPALVANDYISGHSVRRHILANIEIDGEPEFGVSAMVYRGPKDESAYEAAWLTAELQPAESEEAEDAWPEFLDIDGKPWTLRAMLDPAAWRHYRKLAARK